MSAPFGEKEPFRFYVGDAPRARLCASVLAREAQRRQTREELLRAVQSTAFAYDVSLCLTIRDENEYLEEWLRWHTAQGVCHFYIYDHGSRAPVREFLRIAVPDLFDRVTVVDWSGTHKDAQPDAYNDCLRRFGRESRWIGFVDADEQIRVKTGQTLPEFLRGYEAFAALFAVWVTYDANGAVEKTDEPLRRRFTHVSHASKWADRAGKVIVQPMLMAEMVVHNGRAADGFAVVDEHKRPLADFALSADRATTDMICVDHYYTKSYEEWVRKIRRGSGHAKCQRKYEEFFVFNPDLADCREQLSFVQKYASCVSGGRRGR